MIDNFDINKYPVGQAIIWKMNNMKAEDWDAIPIEEIAEVIKNEGSMIELTEKYGVILF